MDKWLKILLSTLLYVSGCSDDTKPPFSGTIFIDPDIITEKDPTTFISLYYSGQELRTMFDRRENDWIEVDAFIFPSLYSDSMTIEIQVNPEFENYKNAKIVADKYAVIIGRLTTELRKDVETVWIHRGMHPFGGGNNNILIHTDWSMKHYEKQGILEETLVHEASHTSLDAEHSKSADWINAQEMDDNFISNYARDHPIREDIAESYLPYLAIRYRSDRISDSLKVKIEKTIPNRIRYFDNQKFKMYPIEKISM